MSKFLSGLLVEDNDNGIRMTLRGAMVYHSDLLGDDVKVPCGFTTDFASIPRPLWAVIPQHGKYDRAAVVHDYLYQNGGYLKNNVLVTVSRKTADDVFNEAMAVLGVRFTQRWVIYAGVRIGGHVAWDHYRA